jgi:Tol biopolymer transport system component
MNMISHKQAIQLIDRRLDGMLKANQQYLLDEHLRTCDSCRLYASEMDRIPARLTHEFKTRWDANTGPSLRVMDEVTFHARNIKVAKRFSSNLRVLSGVVALILLAFVINFLVSRLRDTSVLSNTSIPTLNPVNLTIDPQSCKPSTESSAPNELYGYDIVQNASFTDGDFTYEFWLYCDPSLKVNDKEHFSAVSGLGIYSLWRYTGPRADGPVEYYYGFEENEVIGKSGSDGPLYKSSAAGKFGINISEAAIRNYIQQGDPIQFRVTVNSSLGQHSAILSFQLQPTQNGLKIVDVQAGGPQNMDSGLLAFAADGENGNPDIFTMRPDGSRLTNLTNNPAVDTMPFWSPDGKRIAFESDRDGSRQIYLMDMDGSNIIQLTQWEGNYALDPNGYTPWSPDGRKLIVSHGSPAEHYELYAIDITDKSITTLTQERGQYFLPSWSPDGGHIAFLSDTGGIPRDLFVVDSDGTHLTKLTETLRGNEFFMSQYEWSSDGTSLFFATNQKMYRFTVEGNVTLIAETADLILDWWNGGAVRVEIGENLLKWLRSDGSQSTLGLCKNSRPMLGIAQKRSKNGNLVFGSNCSARGWVLYWSNQDGTTIHQLLNMPISADEDTLFNMVWSPDDRYLTFVGLDTTSPTFTSTLYVLDVTKAKEDPSIQPVKMSNSSSPSWQPVP